MLASGTVSRRSKKATTVEAVLLKALGITQTDLEVNEEAIEEFRTLFDSPVRRPRSRHPSISIVLATTCHHH
jgi:hypothetical protein